MPTLHTFQGKNAFSDKWIDEEGFDVLMVKSPFGGLFYIDEESKRLNEVYNPHFKISEVARMGSAGLEDFSDKICSLFPIMKNFGGFDKKNLDDFAELYQSTSAPNRLINYGFMRNKKIAGIIGIFPTEELIHSCFGKWERKWERK